MKRKVVLIGGATGREHAIAKQLAAHPSLELHTYLWADSPPIRALSTRYEIGNLKDTSRVVSFVKSCSPAWTIVGQGEVIQEGIRDLLDSEGIPCIAPTREMAILEGSKSFTRNLLRELDPSLAVRYATFEKYDECAIRTKALDLGARVVLKCDKVVQGPRVKTYGTTDEGLGALLPQAEVWLDEGKKLVLEEFIEGAEVAMISITDGKTLIHSPPFRNYKKMYDGDLGDNTLGLGCATAGKTLPGLEERDVRRIQQITENVFGWLKHSFKQKYLGALYGEFIVSRDGRVKVIEYNNRFGNPSSINLLALLKPNFGDVCERIIGGTLDQLSNVWKSDCTVSICAPPAGLPFTNKNIGKQVDLVRINTDLLYVGRMNFSDGTPQLMNSRAFAILGRGESLAEARVQAYGEIEKITAPIHYRKDIGARF